MQRTQSLLYTVKSSLQTVHILRKTFWMNEYLNLSFILNLICDKFLTDILNYSSLMEEYKILVSAEKLYSLVLENFF